LLAAAQGTLCILLFVESNNQHNDCFFSLFPSSFLFLLLAFIYLFLLLLSSFSLSLFLSFFSPIDECDCGYVPVAELAVFGVSHQSQEQLKARHDRLRLRSAVQIGQRAQRRAVSNHNLTRSSIRENKQQ
jgi:hypothetical protein